jgi:hypothetical protein
MLEKMRFRGPSSSTLRNEYRTGPCDPAGDHQVCCRRSSATSMSAVTTCRRAKRCPQRGTQSDLGFTRTVARQPAVSALGDLRAVRQRCVWVAVEG